MNVSPKKPLARRVFKGFAIVAIMGVLGTGVLLAALWLERRTEVTLPHTHGAVRGWPRDLCLDRRRAFGPVGAGSGNQTRTPCLDLVSGGDWEVSCAGRLPAHSSAGAGPSGQRPADLPASELGLGTSDPGSAEGPCTQYS